MRNPDRHYQRFRRGRCQCEQADHGHEGKCGSRRYLVAHHKDHERQDQAPENLITICSSCHRKEHREQSHYYGRGEHSSWAAEARAALQRRLFEGDSAVRGENPGQQPPRQDD